MVTSGIEVERKEKGDRQTLTFAAGPVRDFYIAASDRYKRVSEQVGETTLNSFAPPEFASEARLALRYAADALRIFSRRVGPYPFTELDVAGTPTQAGGVEYPGVVVVALDIYDPENRFFEAATAHEVGHQWFYSVVGNDQVDEPWLDESLTQYATLLYYTDMYGAAGEQGFRGSLEERWQSVDSADVPIGLPVAAYDESEYSAIIYGRGALFFEALAAEMGEDAFASFLRDYYKTFAWDTVDTEEFKQLAEQNCACDLTPLFEEWVYEK